MWLNISLRGEIKNQLTNQGMDRAQVFRYPGLVSISRYLIGISNHTCISTWDGAANNNIHANHTSVIFTHLVTSIFSPFHPPFDWINEYYLRYQFRSVREVGK